MVLHGDCGACFAALSPGEDALWLNATVPSKIPKNAQAEVKANYWKTFESADVEPGLDAVAFMHKNIDAFAQRWCDAYPAAVRILLSDRESLTHYLRVPREHRTRMRHSNFIERTFGETRRRTKVIGRLPGETSCISLVWAVHRTRAR